MNRQARIEAALTETFAPLRLQVIDESHLHAGHQPGMDGSGETHFRVRLESAAFTGRSRIDRHRAVNAALQAEFDAGLHALAVEAAGAGEATRW
ncbi:BolA family protein [Pseudohoeflea coraliihabitans]|uniref:BolA family transcriptional regulator n=1 Tax=Pseudohoeflea coraliihabitans TaxID=2860393 RepID=A0ABS6WN89_9HYPH|nr:BolA family protein [Pseudohoeflea sp. DP4N28-3]MBW3096539.1 BolA family transcriptional regulator [Pseudohoeflea sp. DP4N28-3]